MFVMLQGRHGGVKGGWMDGGGRGKDQIAAKLHLLHNSALNAAPFLSSLLVLPSPPATEWREEKSWPLTKTFDGRGRTEDDQRE